MENSQAYMDFIKQINASGRQKMEGYYSLTLEKIYEWERDVVEDIIWKNFVEKNDSDLAVFMPKLKKYKGIEALKAKLKDFSIPSGANENVAEALYTATNEKKYLDLIIKNYKLSDNKTLVVARLARLAKNNAVYPLLVDIYINDDDSKNRLCALQGILWKDGFIKDIDDLKELSDRMKFLRMFKSEIKEERRTMMVKYGNGEFDNYKTLF